MDNVIWRMRFARWITKATHTHSEYLTFFSFPPEQRPRNRATVLRFIYNVSFVQYTRWFKYDRDDLCVNKSRFVPVIFEPPCIFQITSFRNLTER
jgi:hypothetical protein